MRVVLVKRRESSRPRRCSCRASGEFRFLICRHRWHQPECLVLLRCCTWSFIRAMRGVMTIHTPSLTKAGTWKVMDLPPPVGIRPRVSSSAGNAFDDIALNASEIRIPPILLQNKLKLICHFFLVIWPDSLYLKLDLILLENIVLNGVCNVETAAAFDVSGSRALPEGNSVHYGTRLRIYQFQFDMLLLSAHHLAGAVIIYVLRAEYGFAIAWTEKVRTSLNLRAAASLCP